MQAELSDSEVRRAEVEAQIRQTHNVSSHLLITFSRTCVASLIR
jgi:hypothetical protein